MKLRVTRSIKIKVYCLEIYIPSTSLSRSAIVAHADESHGYTVTVAAGTAGIARVRM